MSLIDRDIEFEELSELRKLNDEMRGDLVSAYWLLAAVLYASGGSVLVQEGTRRDMPRGFSIQTELDHLGRLFVRVGRGGGA